MPTKTYVVSYIAYIEDAETSRIYPTKGFMEVGAETAGAAWGVAWNTLNADALNVDEELQGFQIKNAEEGSFNYVGHASTI